jgi:hypothetical protein
VYLYARPPLPSVGDWPLLSKVTNAESGSVFGWSVALSNTTMEIIIGGQCAHSCIALFPSNRQ